MSAYIHNTRGFLQMPTKMIVTYVVSINHI